MMGSKHKPSYSATTRSHEAGTHPSELDNDENNLIPPGKAFVTINIQAGDDASSSSVESRRKNPNLDDASYRRSASI
jgi:hypothetical protein